MAAQGHREGLWCQVPAWVCVTLRSGGRGLHTVDVAWAVSGAVIGVCSWRRLRGLLCAEPVRGGLVTWDLVTLGSPACPAPACKHACRGCREAP